MADFTRILKADRPLTLASVARGAQPLVMADLARAAKGRAVFVAPDEQAMRAVTDAAHWFAPELQVIEFPAWDCLPYDRASPAGNTSKIDPRTANSPVSITVSVRVYPCRRSSPVRLS